MDPFLKACGATGPLRLSVECPGAPEGEPVAIDRAGVVIGRDPGADLRLPHPDVSERHVYLQVVAGGVRYLDLGSGSGTFLGGRCLRSGRLARRQAVRVGPYRVRLLGGDAGARPTPAGRTPRGAPPRLTVEVSHRGIRPAVCPVAADWAVVGSAADCDVRLLDPSASNYHCSLLSTRGGVWVVDLLGLGGVRLNGTPVRLAPVRDGDELRVGHSRLRLRVEPVRGPQAEPRTTPALTPPPPRSRPAPRSRPPRPTSPDCSARSWPPSPNGSNACKNTCSNNGDRPARRCSSGTRRFRRSRSASCGARSTACGPTWRPRPPGVRGRPPAPGHRLGIATAVPSPAPAAAVRWTCRPRTGSQPRQRQRARPRQSRPQRPGQRPPQQGRGPPPRAPRGRPRRARRPS